MTGTVIFFLFLFTIGLWGAMYIFFGPRSFNQIQILTSQGTDAANEHAIETIKFMAPFVLLAIVSLTVSVWNLLFVH